MTVQMSMRVIANNPFSAARLLGLTRELMRYENQWAADVVADAKRYPPERQGQSYKRTFRFKRGWRITPARFVGGSLQVRIENRTPYGPQVVGDSRGQGQSGWHVGRWYVWRDLASSKDFARGAQAIINRSISGIRFSTTVTP